MIINDIEFNKIPLIFIKIMYRYKINLIKQWKDKKIWNVCLFYWKQLLWNIFKNLSNNKKIFYTNSSKEKWIIFRKLILMKQTKHIYCISYTNNAKNSNIALCLIILNILSNKMHICYLPAIRESYNIFTSLPST